MVRHQHEQALAIEETRMNGVVTGCNDFLQWPSRARTTVFIFVRPLLDIAFKRTRLGGRQAVCVHEKGFENRVELVDEFRVSGIWTDQIESNSCR
jgi:hypothetical protein